MNLLIISNNPNRASFRQRIGIYVDTLRSAGINCEVAKLPAGPVKRFGLFRRAADFDAVFLHKKCLNFFDAICLRHYSKKIIYDFDDAVMYSPINPSSNRTSHFRLFCRTAKLADMIIAGNSYLAEHAKRFNNNVHLLPTGLDTKAYDISIKPKDDGKIRLVWIGSKSTLIYLEGIKPALEEIGKKYPNAVLRIICDQFFDLENMKVEKCRWSLADQTGDLVSSHIGLAPLPDNRFTRGKCGFKVLQYQAAQLASVTSPVGANLDFVRDGITGFIAANTTDWVDKISRLLEGSDLRKQMGQTAKKQVRKFDRKVIGRKLSELISKFVEADINTASTIDRPKVSICIPTYNRKEYLMETLESIFAQTYKNYEIVIVDDGSTDGTEEMLKQLDFPITYHWQENGGDASARNKLIELAKGPYISFIDSDDILMPDAIEKMVQAMEAEDEDIIVYGSYYRIDQDGKIYGKCRRKLYNGNITKHLFESIIVHSCGAMFPKKILKESVVFDTSLKVCSDYALWLSLSTKYPFKALAEPTFKRRRHPDNLSLPSFKNCLTEFKVLKDFYYEKGGKEVIPEKTAKKVFGKEASRAGRCAIKDGLYEQGYQLLGQSFRYHPSFKTFVYWTKAMISKRWAKNQQL